MNFFCFGTPGGVETVHLLGRSQEKSVETGNMIDHAYLVPLSLRNLVSAYECGRVLPAGVGPGSPSRDADNWLPSRFSPSACQLKRGGGMVG